MNIILIGPQGSGKGTQAELLSKKFGLQPLSVGQLYRKEIRLKTAIGKKAEPFVLKGKLVPDSITELLLKKELRKNNYKHGVIFDGFPRNIAQNEFLEKLLNVDSVILIDISHEEILRRLSGRYVCDCGQIFNLYSDKSKRPQKDMTCDKCGQKLKQRPDDTAKAITQRLKVYQEETLPLIKYFKKNHKLITISGEQKMDKVFKAILMALKHKGLL